MIACRIRLCADNFCTQVRTGVGKYLPAALPGAAAVSSMAAAKSEAAPAAAAALPPGKQKGKQQPAMNFDAW